MLELTVTSFFVPPVQERSVQLTNMMASEKVHYPNQVELLCLGYLFIIFLVDFSDHNFLVGIPWNLEVIWYSYFTAVRKLRMTENYRVIIVSMGFVDLFLKPYKLCSLQLFLILFVGLTWVFICAKCNCDRIISKSVENLILLI